MCGGLPQDSSRWSQNKSSGGLFCTQMLPPSLWVMRMVHRARLYLSLPLPLSLTPLPLEGLRTHLPASRMGSGGFCATAIQGGRSWLLATPQAGVSAGGDSRRALEFQVEGRRVWGIRARGPGEGEQGWVGRGAEGLEPFLAPWLSSADAALATTSHPDSISAAREQLWALGCQPLGHRDAWVQGQLPSRSHFFPGWSTLLPSGLPQGLAEAPWDSSPSGLSCSLPFSSPGVDPKRPAFCPLHPD